MTTPSRTLATAQFRRSWCNIHPDVRASLRACVARGLETLKTTTHISLCDWAEKHFYLSAESSQRIQRWEAWPFQRGILHAMGDDYIEEITLRKSARVGYSKMLTAAIGYFAQHKHRNQCVWQPTDSDSDEFCKTEIEPMLKDVGIMKSVLPKMTQKNKGNTLRMKKFLGSILFMKGGTSSGNYRRMTLQVAILDEFSAFDQKIEKSSDPWTLAHKRLEGATYPKLIAGSTPRIKDLDHTERREAAATARLKYHITCPHCQAEHPLIWGSKKIAHGIKWDPLEPETSVRHVCPHCHGSIIQADYLRLQHQGHWASDCGNYQLDNQGTWTNELGTPLTTPPRHVAFHVWTAYSPQVTWSAIVREFVDLLRAKRKGEQVSLEGFTNETLGETWEDEVEKTDSHELQKRAEPYPLRRVPLGGLDLVAAVDVQDGWWAIAVWAIGRSEEMWVIDWHIIEGDLSLEGDWETRLYPYLHSNFTHWHGRPMKISAVAIDTGGHYTHTVYNFCRKHAGEKYFAVKGESMDGKPIISRSSNQDINLRGRIIKHGVKLWLVGTDTAKDLIFARLKLDQPGPGYLHFSTELKIEFYNGLTSEVRRTVRTTKGDTHRWVKVTQRNEPLDCLVYALFASLRLGHDKKTENQWAQLENALLPDLFNPIVTPIAPITPALPAPHAAPTLPAKPAARPIQTSADSYKPDSTQPTLPAAPPAISYTPSTGPTDNPDAYFDLDDPAVIALYAPA
jgi:phage terminase large subunit GpA-like protein